MKKVIEYICAYYGWNSPFAMKVIKTDTTRSADANTQEIATRWLASALKRINKELARQIEYNGFEPHAIKQGKILLNRVVTQDRKNEDITHETYSIGAIEIMRIQWNINGFTLHVKKPLETRRSKKAILLAVKRDKGKHGLIINRRKLITSTNITIEEAAIAQEYLDGVR